MSWAARQFVVTRAVLNGATFQESGDLIGIDKSTASRMFRRILTRTTAAAGVRLPFEVGASVEKHRAHRDVWLAAMNDLEKRWNND